MRDRTMNPEETLSAKIMDECSSKSLSHDELGFDIAERYKNHYLNRNIDNKNWELLENERKTSLIKCESMEKLTNESTISFDEFKLKYMK